MTIDVNGVKKACEAVRTYHHGDLRAALLAAALAIIEVEPDKFSLRAAARRAGVSPAAPAHHFGDTRGLLTAVATIGFVELGDALAAAARPDARDAIIAQGHAYLAFARTRPGLFRLMWRREVLDVDQPDYFAAAKRAFTVSEAALHPDEPGPSPAAEPASATIACWSMVHGFVSLVIDGAFFAHDRGASGELDALLDATLRHLDLNPG